MVHEVKLDIINNLKQCLKRRNMEEAKEVATQVETQLGMIEEVNEKFLLLNVLAKYYRKTANYDKAGDYSRQAIRLAKQVSDDHIKVIIDTFIDYAALEREYGQQSTARIELAQLLALLDKRNYHDDFAYGIIFSNLGKIALDEENFESGLNQTQKALSYFRKSLPNMHPLILDTIQMLSDAYIQVENYEQALQLHEELAKGYQRENNGVEEARQLLKIGEIYFYLDLKKARRTITEAIKKLEKVEEKQPFELARANFMLAELDENMGSLPRAITYYKRALQLLQESFNKQPFMTVYAYSKIGTISMKINLLEQAKNYLEAGLKQSGDFPKIRLQFLYALGKIYSSEKQYDKAFALYSEFLERLEKGGRKKSLAYGNTLQAIGFNLLQQDKIDEATIYYEQAFQIYEHVPNCKEEKGMTCIRLAHCYENNSKREFDQAELYYEKGYKLIEKIRNKDLLEEALLAMVQFFTRNPNPKKRRIYEDKLVKLQTNKNK